MATSRSPEAGDGPLSNLGARDYLRGTKVLSYKVDRDISVEIVIWWRSIQLSPDIKNVDLTHLKALAECLRREKRYANSNNFGLEVNVAIRQAEKNPLPIEFVNGYPTLRL